MSATSNSGPEEWLHRDDAQDRAHTAVVAALQLVPVVGGSLATLFGEYIPRRRQERLIAFIADLAEAAQRLDKTKVDYAFLQSDEGADLLLDAFAAAAETRDAGKRQLIASILVGAADQEREEGLDMEGVLASVAELSSLDLLVARTIYRAQASLPSNMIDPSAIMARERETATLWPEEVRPNLAFHLKRLERAGLIAEFTGTYFDYSGGVYQVTPTFRRLMQYLESKDSNT